MKSDNKVENNREMKGKMELMVESYGEIWKIGK